jgi:CheY-like chemotaxis protein
MKLPYVLLADSDVDHRNSFLTVFEKQVAYATVTTMDDAQSLLSYLSGCNWKDLPSMIILNYYLPDMTAPDLMRELLPDTRYLNIPKLILIPAADPKLVEECRILGVRHFLQLAGSVFDLEDNMRKIDAILKGELHLA